MYIHFRTKCYKATQCPTHNLTYPHEYPTVLVHTCAHDCRKHPALAVLHGAEVGTVPTLQNVHAVVPMGWGHTAGVRWLPEASQYAIVTVRIDLWKRKVFDLFWPMIKLCV